MIKSALLARWLQISLLAIRYSPFAFGFGLLGEVNNNNNNREKLKIFTNG